MTELSPDRLRAMRAELVEPTRSTFRGYVVLEPGEAAELVTLLDSHLAGADAPPPWSEGDPGNRAWIRKEVLRCLLEYAIDGRALPLCEPENTYIREAYGALEFRPTARPAADIVRCEGCGQIIDPDTCGCGEPINGMHDNHSPIPMGCDCYRDKVAARWRCRVEMTPELRAAMTAGANSLRKRYQSAGVSDEDEYHARLLAAAADEAPPTQDAAGGAKP